MDVLWIVRWQVDIPKFIWMNDDRIHQSEMVISGHSDILLESPKILQVTKNRLL